MIDEPDDPLEGRRKRIVRRQAMQQMCLGGDGKLHPNARLIAAYLHRYCGVNDDRMKFPRDATGKVDAIAMARNAGRREVFDQLVRMLAVSLEDYHNLGKTQ